MRKKPRVDDKSKSHSRDGGGAARTLSQSDRKEIREEEQRLVERARLGDKNAFRVLVERYQQRAFRIALDIVKIESDAQDVVQESFVKAYLNLSNFKGDSSFFTWLYRIVFNMAIDLKRKHARRGGSPEELDDEKLNVRSPLASEMIGVVESPDVALLRKQQRRLIDQAMDELSDEHRTVVRLREVEGLRYEEIAEVVGISRGTVMSRLHYARKYLKEALGTMLGAAVGAEVVPFPSDVPENKGQKGDTDKGGID